MSWKVADDVIQHIAVKEVGKENAFSLGQTLMIGESRCRPAPGAGLACWMWRLVMV